MDQLVSPLRLVDGGRKIGRNEPILVEMSNTVITTEGIKTACAQRVRRMEGESRGLLTIVARVNTTRIDLFLPQIAHVLKANMTGINYVNVGRPGRNDAYLRSDERMARTRRPSPFVVN
jgi:hypothetical protein